MTFQPSDQEKDSLESKTASTATVPAKENGNGSAHVQTTQIDLDQLRQLDKNTLIERVMALSRDKVELERKRFVDNGLSRFTEIMRLRVDSTLESWAEDLLLELVPFVSGLQAAVFMLEDSEGQQAENAKGEPTGYLRRIGGYALPEDALDRLELNHGLTGQVARTGERLYYQTPEYFRSHTESSLSKIQAKVLLVQPLIQNERVEGVLELTAVQDFEPSHLQFIEALAGTIAGNLITLRSQVQIQHLYAEAQERQVRMEKQDEEMRQNLEELEATQEQIQKAQAQSEEAEARAKQFLAEIPVGIVVVNAVGEPFYANRKASELLGPGISPDATEEEIGRLYTRKRAGTDQEYPTAEQPITKALSGEPASADDLEMIINGTRVQVEVTASPIYNDNEELTYAIATYKDITEQKAKAREIKKQNEELASREEEMRQNMEELEATQEQMRQVQSEVLNQRNIMNSILDSNADAIIAVDKNYRLLSANAAVRSNYEGTGLEPTEGELLWSFIPQEQQEYYRDCYGRAMGGERFTEELSYEDDGKVFYFSSAFYPILGENNDIIGAANQTSDVTARRRQEEEIKNQAESIAASEEELRQNLEEMEATREEVERVKNELQFQDNALQKSMATIEFDTSGYIVKANANFLETVGYTQEEVRGKHHSLFVDPEYAASEDYKAFWEKLRAGEFVEGEFKRIAKSGDEVWLKATYNPVLDHGGKAYKIIKFANDITTEKLKEEELRQKNEEIQAQEEELRQNMEEMEATVEEMTRTKGELETREGILNKAALVSETDKKGYITYCNEAFAKTSGYEVEDLIGENHNIVRHPDMPQETYKDLWSTIGRGHIWQGKIKNRKKDGSHYWVLATMAPVLGKDGKPYKYIGVRFEITDMVDQQEQLEKQRQEILASEEELRQNMEEMEATQEEMQRIQQELTAQEYAIQNSTMMIEFDLKGTVLRANQNFFDIIGYDAEELYGKDLRKLLDPEAVEQDSYRQMWERLNAGEFVEGEFEAINKAGEKIWLRGSYNPILGASGQPVKVLQLAMDITKQKQLEEQMRQQAEELQAGEEELRQNMEEMEATVEEMTRTQAELETRESILNKAALVSETDKKGIITYCNEQFAKVSGYEVDDLIGQNHNIVRHPDMPKETFKDLWSTIGRGQIWQGKIKNQTKDGGHYWVQATMAPVLGKDGKPYKYVGVRFEITEMVEQQEQMRQQAEELQAQEEELRQSMEEMEATREEVDRIKAELENQDTAIQRSNAVIEFDVDGNIRRANKNFLEVIGYDAEEVEGRHHRMFVEPAEAASPEYREFWAKLKRGEYMEGTYKRYRKDGSVVWLRATYNPVMNSEGVPYKVMKFALDVSHQKQQEQLMREQTEEMRAQEEELRQNMEEMEASREEVERVKRELQFQDNAIQRSTAFIEFDVEGNILKANDNFLERLGYKAFEVKNRHHRMFVDPTYAASEEYAEFWERLKKGEYFEGEYQRIDKQGESVWLRASYNPILNEDGRPYKVVKIAMDITEQKLQEQVTRQQSEEIQAQEEELRQSMEEMDATREEVERVKNELTFQDNAIQKATAVVEFDLQGNILRANEKFANLTGYTREELEGEHHSKLVDSEYAKSPQYTAFWTQLRNGEFQEGEFERIGKSGEHIWLHATYNPVMNAEGKPYKVLKLAYDVTEQKQQSSEIAQQAEEIAASEEELRQNMEEMQATQEEVDRLKNEMEHIHNALNRSNAIIEFDIDGHILHANKKFLDLLGYQLDDIIDEHHRIFVNEREGKSKAYKDFWKALADGQFQEGEYRRLDKDGNIVRLKATYNPILDESGVPYKVVKFATPVKKSSTFSDKE